jgi:hypothetical protein
MIQLVQRWVRAIVPYLLLPLSLIASVLSAAPWLQSFPASIAAAPLYGAAILSVLIPLVVVRIKPTWLWFSVVIDVVVFALYALLVVVQDPAGFGDVVDGLFRGPSQILTFALPLVSPRSLMVAPAALIWLAGTIAGECVARRWYTMLPYVGFLVAFGLAYAGTQRAVGTDIATTRARETLLAASLLTVLLLMRVAQAWVRQDETAESTEAEGVLPLRGLLIGTVTALVIALIASLAVQTSAFPKRADTPQRIPTVDQSRPLTPLAFVAGLRPPSEKDPGQSLFTVTTDRASQGYFAIANVDFYDGAGWSFTRTFRPSGGVLPADTDPALRTTSVLTQNYTIANGPLTQAPWMPFVYRAQNVTGAAVNIDPASGMIVPASVLRAGTNYTVRSAVTAKTFDRLKARTASPDTATPTIDTQPLPRTRALRYRRPCRSCRRCSAICARSTRCPTQRRGRPAERSARRRARPRRVRRRRRRRQPRRQARKRVPRHVRSPEQRPRRDLITRATTPIGRCEARHARATAHTPRPRTTPGRVRRRARGRLPRPVRAPQRAARVPTSPVARVSPMCSHRSWVRVATALPSSSPP